MLKTILLFIFCSLHVSVFSQSRFDVVITEIMSDPTPQVGLPGNEWIELKNTSPAALNLQGWRIGDASGTSGPMPGFLLQPGAYVIICTSSAVQAMSAFGSAIAVTSFPSLDNAGDRIVLQDAQGRIIHAVEYSSAWHDNAVKADGGWTLEMVDTSNPCTGSGNWKSSQDASGGTPGRKNAVDAANPDVVPPRLLRSYTLDANRIVAIFDEPLDSSSASVAARYSINPNMTIAAAEAQAPMFQTVVITLAAPLHQATEYLLAVNGVTDCSGNVMGHYNEVKTGMASALAAGDLVVNEILFNPKPGVSDFVELYNRSNKILDLSTVKIANRSSTGALSSLRNVSEVPFFIFPGEYIALTADPSALSKEYFVPNPDRLITLSLPSYPNNEGTVVLTDQQGGIIDEVKYSEKWHFRLLTNRQGVSLERINPAGASQDEGNWTSAASSVGFATPAYKNSQMKEMPAINATVAVSPRIFSPDGDGYEDLAFVAYAVKENGYLGNVTIFNAAGQPVRRLVQNGVMGLKGSWTWDGLGERGQKLPIGNYIIYTEVFTLDGKRQQFKNAIVLARRLN